MIRATWVAQSVERLTLDICSGHALVVMGSSPVLGFVLSVEPAWEFSLSLSLSQSLFALSHAHRCSLSLSQNK